MKRRREHRPVLGLLGVLLDALPLHVAQTHVELRVLRNGGRQSGREKERKEGREKEKRGSGEEK
jgi:hypothetical protein